MKTDKRKPELVKEEVLKTLQALDSVDPIEARPFFYTRLRQAITEREEVMPVWFYRLTAGYKLVPVGLVFLIMVNIISLALSFSSIKTTVDKETLQLQQAAEEYSMQNWSFESYQTEL